jgi:hypothetical protein
MEEVLRIPKRPRINATSSDAEAFQDYVAMENRRCMEHGVSEPGKHYLTQDILNDTMAIVDKSGGLYIRMLVGVCSASSIVALRATLMFIRGANVPLQPPAANLSVSERFSAIEASESQIMSLTMLKRCHVLKLWEHHCAHHASHDGWVSVDATPESTPNRPGNPHNHERSLATKAIVGCVYPGITEQSEGYTSKYNRIKRLLGLGQKLSMLTHKFGLGVLGLIQCFEFDATKTSFPNLSDRMSVSKRS